MEMEQAHSQAPHLAILPSPGMGHLIPLVEFAKRLVHHHNFLVTFILPGDRHGSLSKSQKSILTALPDSIHHRFLPPPDLDDLEQGSRMETIISLATVRSLPSLRAALESLAARSKLVGLVVDLFGADAFEVAKELNLSYFLFFPSSAMSLSFCLHLPKLDKLVPCEYREHPEPIEIPGCIPIHGKDLPNSVQERQNAAYKWAIHRTKLYKSAQGILVNSFKDLEPDAIKFLQQLQGGGDGNPPVYAVGPLVNMDSKGTTSDELECLKWLDLQPNQSVLFVSFGSGGTLSNDQINELALGLEMSEQRFLWVTRSPNENVSNGAFFGVQSKNNPFEFLPEGFIDRTKERGLVVASWAPQPQILTHASIGGFLTHCGWNSILESVVNGVPLIAWPLYAEQKMNAVMLTEAIKVALRPKADGENGTVKREEIGGLIRDLILGEREGKRVRREMEDLKMVAAKVVSEDGSSSKTLSELASRWSTNI